MFCIAVLIPNSLVKAKISKTVNNPRNKKFPNFLFGQINPEAKTLPPHIAGPIPRNVHIASAIHHGKLLI